MLSELHNMIAEFKYWEREAESFLLDQITKTTVEDCLQDFRNKETLAKPEFMELICQRYGLTPSMFQALAGLSYLMQVRESCEIQASCGNSEIPVDHWVDITRLTFSAGVMLGMSNPGRGMEVLEVAAQRGLKFIAGPKNKRKDALQRELETIVQELIDENGTFPTFKEVIEALERNETIQEVADGIVFWKNSGGGEKRTTFKSVQNRLTTLKKNTPLH